MRTLLALALAGVIVPRIAVADDDEEATDEEEESDEEPDPEDDEEPDPDEGKVKEKPKPKPGGKDGFVKQDLTGHDLAGTKKANLFEKDRFFVDKVDDEKTEKKTLIQGSLTATSFAYRESGGELTGGGIGADANVPSGSQFLRLFTELRSQTDFRHIGGGKWDARADLRARYTADPGTSTPNFTPADNSSSQSGFLGENELEIRELWLIRGGKRSDLIFGRQFVPDLAGVKFDGLRVDYAKSEKLTFLGFGGLYPIRGSRSITTDYTPLKGDPDAMGTRPDAGRFTGAGGFGAAYRTQNAYGSFGGVTLVPLAAEEPRVFGTATGYWRLGPKLDFYHFIVLDLLGSNAVNAGLTNLSGGLNIKPDQRLRGTLSFHRVDTETLNVQAQAFLNDPTQNIDLIQNEAFLIRVAQNTGRASLSAGLGPLQRFEVTVAATLRFRGEVVLNASTTGQAGVMANAATLPAGKSIEVYGGIVDRRSFKKLRIGVDGSRIFRSGDSTYQRTVSNSFRGFVSRELQDGHGEWEAELTYVKSQDDLAGAGMACGAVLTCFGSASSNAISAGGNLFYRFNRDWFGMATLLLTRQSITSVDGTGTAKDPPVTGLSGFLRAAYRF